MSGGLGNRYHRDDSALGRRIPEASEGPWCRKSAQGLLSDVNGEEGLEEGGVGGEGAEGAGAEAGVPVEKEQDAGHALGQGEQGTVGGFVGVEAASGDGVGEEERLAEGEGEAFSGDGVDGARGVADEGDLAEGDAGASDAGMRRVRVRQPRSVVEAPHRGGGCGGRGACRGCG